MVEEVKSEKSGKNRNGKLDEKCKTIYKISKTLRH